MLADEGEQNTQCVLIETTLGDDEVCIHLCWFDETVMPRPHNLEVLLDHGIDCPSPLLDIPLQPANEADIVWCIYIELEVYDVPDPWVAVDHDALENDELLRMNVYRLRRTPVVNKIVLRHLDRVHVFQGSKLLEEEVIVKGIRMIEVEGSNIGITHELSGTIVVILRYADKIRHDLGYFPHDRRLA